MSYPDTDAGSALPFQLDHADVHGRIVRLGGVPDAILSAHAELPEAIAKLMAELLAMTAIMSASLKTDGLLTVQLSGDGPLRLMVADADVREDVTNLRGYARLDENLPEALSGLSLPKLLGDKGRLMFTLDPGLAKDRYQGIVELTGADLASSMAHYFQQSDQLNMSIKLSSGRSDDGKMHASAAMVQRLPQTGGEASALTEEEAEEAWRRVVVLLATVTDRELQDPDLSAADVVYRLFHEEQPRAFEETSFKAQCRCSRDRLAQVIATLSDEEKADCAKDGAIEANCDFCQTVYRFEV